jgi:hypothetical protein
LRDKVNQEALSSSSIYTPSWAVKLHCFLALLLQLNVCVCLHCCSCACSHMYPLSCVIFMFFWNRVVLKLVLTQEVTSLEVVLEIRGGWLGACFEIRGAWVWIPSASTSHNGGMWKSSHPNPRTALNCSHWNLNLDHIITSCKELQKPNFCTQKLANTIHIWPQQLTFAGKPRITKKIHKASVWVQSWKSVLHIIIRIPIFLLFWNLDLVSTYLYPQPKIRGCANMGCTTNTKMGTWLRNTFKTYLQPFQKSDNTKHKTQPTSKVHLHTPPSKCAYKCFVGYLLGFDLGLHGCWAGIYFFLIPFELTFHKRTYKRFPFSFFHLFF